jgi:hypothetical protein
MSFPSARPIWLAWNCVAGSVHWMRQAPSFGSYTRSVVPYQAPVTGSCGSGSPAFRSARVGIIQTSWMARPSSTQSAWISPRLSCCFVPASS